MTDDTTTIEITEDQRDELKALKRHDRESYKSVIDRLLDGDVSGASEAEKQLAEAWDTAARGGIPDDDLREQLDRIESATDDGNVDTEALGREVARQIDYAHLSDRVSEQVARELGR